MRYIGILMFVIGIILLGRAFTMDTSVATNYLSGNEYGVPQRVNNIGLMADKQNYMIFGAFLTFLGVFTILKSKKKIEKVESGKICPKCAEKVKKNALICRFCRYSFEDNEGENYTIEESIEKTNNYFTPKVISQNSSIQFAFLKGTYEIFNLEFADGIKGNVFQKPGNDEFFFKDKSESPVAYFYDNFENCVNALYYFETTKKISEVGFLY